MASVAEQPHNMQSNGATKGSAAPILSESHHIRHIAPSHWKVIKAKHGFGRGRHPTHIHYHDGTRSVHWDSRGHRLGRFPQVLLAEHDHRKLDVPPLRIWGWEFGNISWWVAQLFTWGSVAWVVNGVYAFHTSNLNAVGYSAFCGGMLFWIGAYLAILQAMNSERFVAAETGYDHSDDTNTANNGTVHDGDIPKRGLERSQSVRIKKCRKRHTIWARMHNCDKPAHGHVHTEISNKHSNSRKQAVSGTHSESKEADTHALESGHAPTHSTSLDNGASQAHTNDTSSSSSSQHGEQTHSYHDRMPIEPWTWALIPRLSSSRWREPGYVASLTQFIGATLFSESDIAGFPGVIAGEYDSKYHLWNWFYWAHQLVGSCGFIVSSIILMAEASGAWWKPALLSLGWHVAFWNLVGAIGFFLSAAFGFLEYPNGCCQHYGTALSTYWGGWAFLLGSYMQLIEVLNPHRIPLMRRLHPRNMCNIRLW